MNGIQAFFIKHTRSVIELFHQIAGAESRGMMLIHELAVVNEIHIDIFT